jgi:mono/diheme cytochrome c family protein
LNYPVWELAMGGGLLIAIVSILHVLISHFAVGGGLWLVLTEVRANRQDDGELRDFVRRHARFFMLLTLVLGAITGVGIWFTIALVSPQAVSALIHGYLWGWAMEWVFFVVEIAAALVYYYGWKKLDRRTHEAVGWIYFGAAFVSLVIINGIITFMLTPGRWLASHAFWDGFFNPTYWPSLVLRTFASFAVAGTFTLLTASRCPRGVFRSRVTRYCASWVFVSTLLVGAASLWYRAAFPDWGELSQGAVPIFPGMATAFVLCLAAVAVLALWPLLLPRTWNVLGVVLLAVAMLGSFGTGEWVREAGRKPFTIKGYLYSTGARVDQDVQLAADGVMAHTLWLNPVVGHDRAAIGHELYRAHCQVCHTMDGYNGLRRYLAHWNAETVASLLPRLEHLRALMPPWHGDEYENLCLTDYLCEEGQQGQAAWPTDQETAERLAWDLSCGLCHTVDNYRPLREAVAGQSREELDVLLDSVGELMEEMPPYLGGPRERGYLLSYLVRVAGPVGTAGPATGAAAGAERSMP